MALKITADNLEIAERTIESLGLEDKKRLLDEVFAAQPNLLASVMALAKLDISHEKVAFALDVLLVAYQSMLESSAAWHVVSATDHEQCLLRVQSRVGLTTPLHESLTGDAIQAAIEDCPEPLLFAFVVMRIQLWLSGLTEQTQSDKSIVLCTLNLVECIAHAHEGC